MAEDKAEQVISEETGHLEGENDELRQEPTGSRLWLLSLAALGVVYGDIGTSPLYAFRFAFGEKLVQPSPENILGVLSLIFWSLMIVISVKYLLYVMQADNDGEGGILALMALLVPSGKPRKQRWVLMILGVFGAALLYGDGMITPAISVLSAVEGLEVATHVLHPYIVPITVVILFLLFVFQKRGTVVVGFVFGPVMLLWFVTLAVLGVFNIFREPDVISAVNPLHGFFFFIRNGWAGFLVLGAVFLVVTGGEALYADMGHFGKRPIRLAWFSVVLPGLLLNYFGQGAELLENPHNVVQPFYLMAPQWGLYPLIILATAATIIASQAVISGAFSLTRQAALLGEFPRLSIVQTSAKKIGQIYIPSVNWVLMLATIGLVLSFRKSENLASAYGVAVTTTMVITTLIAYVLTRERWGWSTPLALAVSAGFLCVDLSFFGANIIKVEEGGWFPLLVGGIVFTLMSTWRTGRAILGERLQDDVDALNTFLQGIAEDPPIRVPGTAVFMTGRREGTPPMLQHHLEHNKVLHERVIILTVVIEDVPHIWSSKRLEIDELKNGFFRIIVHFGFMQDPNVPEALRLTKRLELDLDPYSVTYYVGRRTLIATDELPGMALWRERLFAFMSRNAASTTTFYELPTDRVVELGIRVEI
ncbi:MAG: potassium transporter Kup [Desulfoferrobacter sp.]